MKITFLGHAGALIEAGDIRLVCDPWFSDSGAFLAGWHQLPDNSACAKVMDTATHVFVSHDHQDHFDADVLRALPASVPLLLPDYRLPSWHRLIGEVAHASTVLLADAEVLELGPLRVRVILSPSPRHQDSALIIEEPATGQVVVNLNDCQVDRDQLRDIKSRHPRIDAVLGQFSGATWFPFVYAFSDAERTAAAERKKVNSMRRWVRYMEALRPRAAVAFAGPPALLDPALAPYFLDESSVFTTPVELRRWLEREHPDLARRCVAPLPGDVLEVSSAHLSPDLGIRTEFDWHHLSEYLHAYAARRAAAIERSLARYPEPGGDLFDDFTAHFGALFAVAADLCRAVDAVVGFDVLGHGGGFWVVDFRRSVVARGVTPDHTAHDYRFTLESRFLPPILRGDLNWEEFFFSFRFRAWRPSIASYNEELMSVLRCSAPDDLVEYLRQLRTGTAGEPGTFRLRTDAGAFVVGDTCPHLGTRLTAEDYDPELDAIVCPQHGWRFSVPSGVCGNGRAKLDIAIDAQESQGTA